MKPEITPLSLPFIDYTDCTLTDPNDPEVALFCGIDVGKLSRRASITTCMELHFKMLSLTQKYSFYLHIAATICPIVAAPLYRESKEFVRGIKSV